MCTRSLVGKIIIYEVLCSEKQSNTYTISIRDQNTNTIQMLTRLPLALTQVLAGNNSQKLKNEIRQYFILCIAQKK